MKHVEHGSHPSDALKRKIPDRMPRKESLSAGFALPAFAHSLDGLTLISKSTYPKPRSLSPRQQREVNKVDKTDTNVVRIEHLEVTGDTVSYDSFPTNWKTWHALTSHKVGPRKTREQLAFVTGISVAWITTEPDGSHKLAIQKRDERNRTNPSTYGPSASGAWDLEFTTQNGRQIIKDPSPQSALQTVFHETTEELGLPEALLRDPRVNLVVSGIVEDKRKPHYDIVYFGTLPLSASEVSKIHNGVRQQDVGKEFGAGGTDALTFVDATPTAIQKMLTEVKSPFPPVSVATFLLAGYMLTMQQALERTGNRQEALAEAIRWKKATEKGIQKNYAEMRTQSRASNIIRAGREIKKIVQEGGIKKTTVKQIIEELGEYRPHRTNLPPDEQGLEDVDHALGKAGVERKQATDYILQDLIRSGSYELYSQDAAEKYAEILSYIDPAVHHLHKLAGVTEVPYFSFLQRLIVSDDPLTNTIAGPRENRLGRLQYNTAHGFDVLRVPGSNTVYPLQVETWGSDIKFEDKSHRKLNEDATLAVPFGDGRVLTAIFDGATSREPIVGLQRYGVSGAWYVSHLAALEFPHSEEFKKLSQNPDASAKDVMISLNAWLKTKLQEVEGVNYDDVLYLPGMGATLAITDNKRKVIDIAHVADTVAIAEYDDGFQVLTDNKNASWDEQTTRLIDSIVEESRKAGHPLTTIEASRDQRVVDHLARSYTMKINKRNGTGIVNGQDELVTNDLIYTQTVPIPPTGGMRLHLLTDGIYSVWTSRRDVDKDTAVRKLLGALHVKQYHPSNSIYDAVTRLELDPHIEVLPRIIKEFDDGSRVSLVVKPGDEYSQFRTENKRLLWSDFAEIDDLLRSEEKK